MLVDSLTLTLTLPLLPAVQKTTSRQSWARSRASQKMAGVDLGAMGGAGVLEQLRFAGVGELRTCTGTAVNRNPPEGERAREAGREEHELAAPAQEQSKAWRTRQPAQRRARIHALAGAPTTRTQAANSPDSLQGRGVRLRDTGMCMTRGRE